MGKNLEIGLSMMVKNEEHNIVPCLQPIIDLFAQVVIVDTGSTDGTRDVLREQFRIEPLQSELDPGECFALATPRNRSFGLMSTPWVLTLDADERIDPQELRSLLAEDDSALPDGLFCAWNTELGPDGMVEDYKLCLFRNGFRHRGLVHDTAQPDLRERGAVALWTDRFSLRHVPDLLRTKQKQDWYASRLACAHAREPDWLRYDWFTGYMHYQAGELAPAATALEKIHAERPPLFPVETLNASMVLASIRARQGRTGETRAVLQQAREHLEAVRGDFEVRVNFRVGPWLENAIELAARDELAAIEPYAFAY